MRNIPAILICVGLAVSAGAGYYFYTPKVPPPPANVQALLTKALRERTNPTAGNDAEPASATASGSPAKSTPPVVPADQFAVNLTLADDGSLVGTAVNHTAAPATVRYAVGSIFSNGKSEVVLLQDVALEVPAANSADLKFPVARRTADTANLEGNFAFREDATALPAPLVERIRQSPNLRPAVAQTAFILLNENTPLDAVVALPERLPAMLATLRPKTTKTTLPVLVSALLLLRDGGTQLDQLALMSDPRLPIFTMLDPAAHSDAMTLFGISQEKEWNFWKYELLQGDASIRHFALYGIAQNFPGIALKMLPAWVRTARLDRERRYSSALALALIDESQAQDELKSLQTDLKNDPGLSQVLEQAAQYWEKRSQSPTAQRDALLSNTL